MSVKRWCYAILVVIALIEIASPLIVDTDHAHFWFEEIPGWGSAFGLAACVAIIIVSKLLGKLWLTRPERYYDS
jgi:hypothetical protein